VTSLEEVSAREQLQLMLKDDRIEAGKTEGGETPALDILTEVDTIVLKDSSTAAGNTTDENGSSSKVQDPPIPQQRRLTRLARRVKSIWKK